MPADRLALPLSTAIAPAVAFAGLTFLAEPAWPGIRPTGLCTLLMSLGFAAPLVVLCAPAASAARRFASLALAALGSTALALHAGLADLLAFDIDAGDAPHRATILAAAGVLLGSSAIPAGLVAVRLVGSGRGILAHVVAGAAAGAAGQVLWFAILLAAEGPHGVLLWLWSRVLIHAAVGAVAGILVGSVMAYRPSSQAQDQVPLLRLPPAMTLASSWLAAVAFSGSLAVFAQTHDRQRFAQTRFDAYVVALSNLRRAEEEQLAYPGLGVDLDRARRALLGSVDFDGELAAAIAALLVAIEDPGLDAGADRRFRDAAARVNRRLMDLASDEFLEPQSIAAGTAIPFRFVLRYKVARVVRFGTDDGRSVPVLHLRRVDEMLVDTPYTGLSHGGVATVLLDHVDLAAMVVHAPRFATGALEPNESDARFAITRALLRRDRHDALLGRLLDRGHELETLKSLAQLAARFSESQDPALLRSRLDAAGLAAFDALADELARQVALHEARHAMDGEDERHLRALDDLAAGLLGPAAAAEVRAFLTEIIDGPLGPHYGLASITELVVGANARVNAYLFAGVLLLEGLWGEPVRRPSWVEREGPKGPRQVVLPIDRNSPGWLSISRLYGAYFDLRSLPAEELREHAREFFEQLFREEYRPIRRLSR